MASILYNNHLIVSYPAYDEATKTWKPTIQLTLSLDNMQSFQSKAEAERAGLDAAKGVIDSFESGLGLAITQRNRAVGSHFR
jgi:hypothetical protein